MAIGTTLKIGFDSTKVKTGLSGIKSSFQSIAKVGLGIAKVGAAITAVGVAAGVALTSIVIKLNGIGEAARTSEDRIRNIVKQMGLFGDEADTVSDRLIELSKTTARQIGVDEKVIQSTQAKLSTFAELAESADEVGGSFDRATMAALDMASAGFGEAESNAVQLGKALQDPIKGITALSKSGVTFTEQEKDKIKVLVESGKQLQAQDMILKAVERQVIETAAATANSSDKIKVSFGQIVDAFAMPFSQGFDALPGSLEAVFPRIIAAAKKIGELVGTAIAEAIAGDTEKFFAIGELIGETIQAGFFAGAKFLGHSIVKGTTGLFSDLSSIPGNSLLFPGLANATKAVDNMIPESNLGEDLRRELETSNAGIKARGLMQDFTSKPMPGGTQITPNNMQLHDVKTLLNNIEKNTRTGSKM